MNKRTHILTGALAVAAVLLLGAASVGTGFSAWKTQVGVRAALSMQDGRQLALQEAALTVYQPAVQAAEQTPEETPEAKAAEKSAAAADNAQAPEKTAAPEPAAASRAEDAQPAGEAGTEPGTAEEAADAQAELLALAAPETAEPTALEPEAAEEGRTEAAEPEQKSETTEPEPLESAEPQTNESAAPEQPEPEPTADTPQPEPETQAAAPKGTPVEVSRPQGLCAEYPEVTLQPGGWAEYQVVLVNEGTADAALPELEIPDLPEGLHCEPPELPESGLLRAGERLTLTWIVHCEGEGRPVAFSVTAHLTQLPIAPAPSAAYTIVPGSGREEETP